MRGRSLARLWRRGTAPADAARSPSDLSWSWEHPAPDGRVRGRTLIVDGWIAGCAPGSEVVVTGQGRPLGATAARHDRPDVGAVVGFHLEVAVGDPPPDGRLVVGLGLRAGPGAPVQPLAERVVRVVDGAALPYEDAFRAAETRGAPLHREHVYGSGPPVAVVCGEMLAILCRHAGPRVLDLGCGAGPYGEALRAAGHEVHGVEYAPVPAELARARGLPVVRADARRLPFRDRAFDSVSAVEVLEHVERPEVAVAECARVTRGNLVVSVPNAAAIPHLFPWGVVPWHVLEATHVNFFSAATLETLLRGSFAHVTVGYYLRAFRFPEAPPLYAHLFAVASHDPPPRADGRHASGT
jgi:SAM-dependent methyltransferase